jgi:hypothetical protein
MRMIMYVCHIWWHRWIMNISSAICGKWIFEINHLASNSNKQIKEHISRKLIFLTIIEFFKSSLVDENHLPQTSFVYPHMIQFICRIWIPTWNSEEGSRKKVKGRKYTVNIFRMNSNQIHLGWSPSEIRFSELSKLFF